MKLSYKVLPTLSLLCLTAACSRPITRSLFEQSGRAHIYLPTTSEEKGKVGQLAEVVTYQTHTDTIKPTKGPEIADDPNIKTRNLQEVTVTANRPKVKISTVRNGKINLTFLMTLPKSFMDDRWQVVLDPVLLNGDSAIALPPVVLQGKEFVQAQDKAYARYGLFEKSIIDSARYDSVFFDYPKHRRFMKALQSDYYISYRRDYYLQKSYDRWRSIMERRYMDFNAKTIGTYDSSVNDKALLMLRRAYRQDLYGEDSTKVRHAFYSKYTPEHRDSVLARKLRIIEEKNVPRKYQVLFRNNLTIDSIVNKSVTEKDSIDVARHTYKDKALARNEVKRQGKDTYRRLLIDFPRIDSAHLKQAITKGQDFNYFYSEDIEVTDNLQKKLQVVVNTRVVALDKSTWRQAGRDTLSFVISGLNDLMERTLIDRFAEGSKERADYQEGIDLMNKRNYRGALTILNQYPDYNSAICLAALGYNEQALKFMDYLPATGKVDYLRAIVYARTKDLDKTRQYLLSACKKESFLAFKADIEPEFTTLLQDSSLRKQLQELNEGVDE